MLAIEYFIQNIVSFSCSLVKTFSDSQSAVDILTGPGSMLTAD